MQASLVLMLRSLIGFRLRRHTGKPEKFYGQVSFLNFRFFEAQLQWRHSPSVISGTFNPLRIVNSATIDC